MANITHDAQKERRERLKQKYGDKTQLKKPPQKMYHCRGKAGGGHVAQTGEKLGAGAAGTHAQFLKTRKQLLFFSMRQGGICVREYAK